MKRKPHLHDDTVTLDPDKDRLVEFFLAWWATRWSISNAAISSKESKIHLRVNYAFTIVWNFDLLLPQNTIMLVAIPNLRSCHFLHKSNQGESYSERDVFLHLKIISRSHLACNVCFTGIIRWWNWIFSATFLVNPTYPKVRPQASLQTCRQYHICILGYQFCSYFGNSSANTAV